MGCPPTSCSSSLFGDSQGHFGKGPPVSCKHSPKSSGVGAQVGPMGTGTLMGHPHMPPKLGWNVAHLQLAPNSVPQPWGPLGEHFEDAQERRDRVGNTQPLLFPCPFPKWPCSPHVPYQGLAVPPNPLSPPSKPPVPYLGVPCPFCGSGLAVSPKPGSLPTWGCPPSPTWGWPLVPSSCPRTALQSIRHYLGGCHV